MTDSDFKVIALKMTPQIEACSNTSHSLQKKI